jgi:hypothetical protein
MSGSLWLLGSKPGRGAVDGKNIRDMEPRRVMEKLAMVVAAEDLEDRIEDVVRVGCGGKNRKERRMFSAGVADMLADSGCYCGDFSSQPCRYARRFFKTTKILSNRLYVYVPLNVRRTHFGGIVAKL